VGTRILPPDGEISGEEHRIQKKDLLNFLNYHHFQEKSIYGEFRHKQTSYTITLPLRVERCTEQTVLCRWEKTEDVPWDRELWELNHLRVQDVQRPVRIIPTQYRIEGESISFDLPEYGTVKNSRRIVRVPVTNVAVTIFQQGIKYSGEMEDFSPESFRVRLKDPIEPSIHWLNPDAPCTAVLQKEGELIYSGTCCLSRLHRSLKTLLISPAEPAIRRFRPRQYRAFRQVLTPAPVARIRHPLGNQEIYLPVYDLSSTGIAVEEFHENSLLLPGMMIPELVVELANRSLVRCRAQVLYRKVVPENPRVLRCGITFLDLTLEDQAGLSALLHPTLDPHSFVCNRVDTDELWRFFFESGFIYPDKYEFIRSNREAFKKTYENLYTRSPSIARHFVFRERGLLFGHMSMLRFYSRAWLIHHHAAAKEGHALAGISVLKQVGAYVNEYHVHPSTRMDFVLCYFRPDNKFPNRVFGGVARQINDRRRSSLDSFAYVHLSSEPSKEDISYQLFSAAPEDLEEFCRLYQRTSGGLMAEALDLCGGGQRDEELNREYRDLGFQRERLLFALHRKGSLQAIFMVVLSDTGLNLSNLTNCVHVFITDPQNLEPEVLFSALGNLRRYFRDTKIPILVYPEGYMVERNLPYEKTYTLWALSMEATDDYFKALEAIFKRPMHG